MIEVGYVPYSKDLKHPGDRRRLGAWAKEHSIKLNTQRPLKSDVLVLSNAADFSHWIKRANQPIVLDLVDGYLGEKPSLIKDVFRNIVRSFGKTSNIKWLTYSRHVRTACKLSDAVVVASEEQRDLILPFNSNVIVIQDDHLEIDELYMSHADKRQYGSNPKFPHIFWEGFGYTIKHFEFMSEQLDRFLWESGWGMYFVTVEEFPRWGGYIGKVSTKKLIRKYFPRSWKSIVIIPWALDSLVEYAAKSEFAIIPINKTDKFAFYKSENKLLSMWHLGLPVIFSDTPAYSRVANQMNFVGAVTKDSEWFSKLEFLSVTPDFRELLATKGYEYIGKYHLHSDLMQKWDKTLYSLIPK